METTEKLNGQAVQLARRPTLGEMIVPQRAITDFFKSPTHKETKKPQTLFGYFKKIVTATSPSGSIHSDTENVNSQAQFPSSNGTNGDEKKVKRKPGKNKRKRNSVEELNNSLGNFEEIKHVALNRRKKKAKSTEESPIVRDGNDFAVGATEICCNGKGDRVEKHKVTVETESTECMEDSFDTEKSPEIIAQLNSGSSTRPSSNPAPIILEENCVAFLPDDNHVPTPSSNIQPAELHQTADDETKGKPPHRNEKCKRKTKKKLKLGNGFSEKVSETDSDCPLQKGDPAPIIEMSYEDFLRAEEDTGTVQTVNDVPDLPIPKCHKLFKYFTKSGEIPSTTNSVVDSSSTEDIQIQTTADVHYEPSPPRSKNPSENKLDFDSDAVRTSNILLSDQECDLEILEVSSEIIELECCENHKSSTDVISIDYEDSNRTNNPESPDNPHNSDSLDPGIVTKIEQLTGSKKHSSDSKVKAPQKTTQATLFFSPTGLTMKKYVPWKDSITEVQHSSPVKPKKMGKAVPTTENTNKNPDIVGDKETKRKPGRPRQSVERASVGKNRPANQTREKEEAPSRRSLRIKQKSGEDVDGVRIGAQKLSRKKILTRRYKVSFLEAGDDSRSPIRIRLKRCSKSSGEDDSVLYTPKSSKRTKSTLTKAQKLLEKAKKKSKKGKKTENLARTTSKTNRKEEKMETTRKAEKVTRLRAARKADLCPSRPPKKLEKAKKTPAKLAPIFMKKNADSTPVGTASPRKPLNIDPEILKQRREFLMSRLPENLRRRGAAFSVVVQAEYPPIPTDCHVQQRRTNELKSAINVWCLPEVDLKMRNVEKFNMPSLDWENMTSSASEVKVTLKINQDFSRHPEWNEEVVELMLMEVKRNNPSFPVKRLYQCYRDKKTESETRVQKSGVALPVVNIATEANHVLPQPVKRANSGDSDIVLLDSPEGNGKSTQSTKSGSGGSTNKADKETVESTENTTKNCRLRRSRRKSKNSERKPNRSAESTVEMLMVDSSPEYIQAEIPPAIVPEIVRDQLWTDKYQPSQSMEVMGNSVNVKRLKSWLQEWKERTDKETRMLKKLLRQQLKKKGKYLEQTQESSNDWWTDDDCDFETGSKDDSDWLEGEDSLCNTMLISGPHGVGKTGTVYALAQELGYQVIEVNAASSRSGKRILGKLQEATQSHQVSKQNLEKLLNTPSTPVKTNNVQPAPTSEKLPTAFTNLFKKADSKPEEKKEKVASPKKEKAKSTKTAGNKRKRENEKESSSPKKRMKTAKNKKVEPVKPAVIDLNETSNNSNTTAAKGINLSSTSLILFDEVDIVFEEDKGFWAAIQSFMKITKRPIILTTTDVRFAHSFDGRFEQLIYKQPSSANLITYLQVMCLAECVRTEYMDMVSLVQFHRGDVRRCVQSLQYWIDSGGGLVQEPKSVTSSLIPGGTAGDVFLEDTVSQSQFSQGLEGTPVNTKFPSVTETPSSVIQTPGRASLPSWEDDDDFMPFKKYVSMKSCRRIILDESSRESFPSTPQKSNSQRTLAVPLSSIPEHNLTDENTIFTTFADYSVDSCELPPVHRLCPESVMSTTSYSTTKHFCDIFSLDANMDIAAAVYSLMKFVSCDVISSNIEQLLPLPVVAVELDNWPRRSNCEIDHVEKLKQKKPSRILSDLFTSDSSDDEMDDKSQPDNSKSIDGDTSTTLPVWKKLCADLAESMSKEKRRHLADSVDSLLDFYESVSFIDTMSAKFHPGNRPRTRKFMDVPDFSHLTLAPGLTDQLPSHECCERVNAETNADLAAQLSVRSLSRCCDRLGRVYKEVEGCGDQGYLDLFSLPLPPGRHQLRLSDDIPVSSTALTNRERALDNVRSVLPLYVWSSVRTLAMEYIPCLRDICTAEHHKQLAKTKRRFLHYLDGISLPLRESTMNVLCSSFK